MKMAARMALIAAVMLTTTSVASAADLSESFDTVAPAGWSVVNNSSSVGPTSWFQGKTVAGGGPFDAYDGATNAYAAADFHATGNTGTISLWLITPSLSTLTNGDAWSFYTRKVAPDNYADRLEVRVSTGGGCNPGSGPTSVGDFTTVVTTINPSLVLGVYPTAWTKFSGVLSSLPAGSSTGCLAFRYFVTNAGFSGTNADYVGVDAFQFTEDVIAPDPVSVTAVSPAGPSSNDTPSVTGSDAEADSTVNIYDNAACTGTVLGSGTADDFNGSTGVTATVPHDTTTTLYATATDASGNESACSSTNVSYVNDVTPPAAPTVTATSPTSPSSNDTPSVTGSGAEADSTVRIYDNDACTGTALGNGTAANFNGSTGVTATIPHNTTTTLYATATDPSGNTSACSTTKVSYTNRPTPPKADSPTPPPAPKLTSFATGWRTHDTAPKLSGSAGDGTKTVTLLVYAGQTPTGTPVETQQLPVVNGAWSTKPLTGLAPGPYVAVIHAGAAGAVAISQPVAFEILGPCQSRRLLTLHLYAPKGGYRTIAVTLGGTKLAVRGGKRAPAVRVDLRGRSKGTYTVRIAGTTASGRHVRATRTYRTCGRALR